jgi:hypothetical protein
MATMITSVVANMKQVPQSSLDESPVAYVRASAAARGVASDDSYDLAREVAREVAIRRRVHRLAEFYRHAAVFVIVMTLVWTANFMFWRYWPGLTKSSVFAIGFLMSVGWAIGLLCHALTLMPVWTFLSQDWEDRKVRELVEREAAQEAAKSAQRNHNRGH